MAFDRSFKCIKSYLKNSKYPLAIKKSHKPGTILYKLSMKMLPR